MRVSATEAKNRFGSLSAQAKREPVFVEKAGQLDTVILSAEHYHALQANHDKTSRASRKKRFRVSGSAAFSGITAAFILAVSRAIGETMIVAIAAGQQPRLTGNPFVPIETMTAYIVQVSLGDTPQGTIEYRTIFAVGMLLFVMTFSLKLISTWLRERFREEYA